MVATVWETGDVSLELSSASAPELAGGTGADGAGVASASADPGIGGIGGT